MRRWITLLAVVAATLAAAAVAAAKIYVIHGPAGKGGVATIDISYAVKHGKVTKLTRFEFNNVPATCVGYPNTAVSGTFPHNIKVSKRKFSATVKVNGGRTTYKVNGRFTALHKASGKLRVSGTVPGCLKADTGSVHWSAS